MAVKVRQQKDTEEVGYVPPGGRSVSAELRNADHRNGTPTRKLITDDDENPEADMYNNRHEELENFDD